jgi:hypothetical protein
MVCQLQCKLEGNQVNRVGGELETKMLRDLDAKSKTLDRSNHESGTLLVCMVQEQCHESCGGLFSLVDIEGQAT